MTGLTYKMSMEEARCRALFLAMFTLMLTFEGNCSYLRAKPAHLVGHLPLDANAISKLTPQELIQLQKDLITAENNARVTIAQIIGGLVVLLGLYATFKSVKIAQDNHRVALDNLRVTEEGKLTERFSKAVELLGSEKLDVKLGGIYALERIARDSQKDHWTVMEVLTAFVREQSKEEYLKSQQSDRQPTYYDAAVPELRELNKIADRFRADIQAALTVIGRREWTDQEKTHQRIDLSNSFFAGADLSGASFCRADFNGSDLTEALFFNTDFSGATLIGAKLIRARLNSTKFVGANLSGANFRRSFFNGVKLNRACLCGTELTAVPLEDADLTDTDFGGNRHPAKIGSTDFRNTKGLTWEQISGCNLKDTKLPPELEERRKAEQKIEPDNAAYRAVALKPQIVPPSSSEDA